MLPKSGPIDQIAKAPAQSRGSPDKKAPVNRSPLLPHIGVRRIFSELQDLPCVVGVLPVIPLNGSRVCLARRL